MTEDRMGAIREDLDLLRRRFARGEIDEATYQRQRELILADLTPAERATLGTATPQPATPSPRPGTPHPLGPSGGVKSGVRTFIPSLSDLDLQPGTVLLDQWRLEKELGRGGFGAVFAAEELLLHERQAVKVLDPAMVAKEELLARFRREVSLMRKLVHARIVRVYDYREDLQQLVALISMELVTGGSVKQLLALAKAKGQPIPIPLALEILTQTLEALAEAHAQGVIHRDVTPGNVLLAGGTPEQLLADPARDPHVKLVDFGIAGLVERTELSAKSRVLGTAAYVAPEVLDPSVEVTPAADVYGAGAMAYELLTGELPVGRFEGVRELRAEVPEGIDRFVTSLLEKRPEKRPQAKVGAWGLRGLREEEEQTAAREEAERRSEREDESRQREELVRREAEERARQEAARQREQMRLRAEAEAARHAEPPAEEPPAAKRGFSGGAWLAIAAAIVVVLIAVGWAISSQRAAEKRVQVEQARLEREKQVAVQSEQRKAAEAAEAERERQARVLEEEKKKAAEAERQRIAKEQEKAQTARLEQERREAMAAEAARLEQKRREAEEAAQRRREEEAAAQRRQEEETAAQRRRAAEETARRERETEYAERDLVTAVSGSRLTLSMGQKHGVALGMRAKVCTTMNVGDRSVEVCVARVRVTEVLEQRAMAEVIEGDAKKVGPGFRVVFDTPLVMPR